jgi:mycothiol system anti-sigma-R factor
VSTPAHPTGGHSDGRHGDHLDRHAAPGGHPAASDVHADAHALDSPCSEVLLRIFEYLDGELDPEDVHRFAAHLDECGPCLAEHDVDRALKELVRRSCGHEQAPSTLRMQVVQRITVVRRELGG